MICRRSLSVWFIPNIILVLEKYEFIALTLLLLMPFYWGFSLFGLGFCFSLTKPPTALSVGVSVCIFYGQYWFVLALTQLEVHYRRSGTAEWACQRFTENPVQQYCLSWLLASYIYHVSCFAEGKYTGWYTATPLSCWRWRFSISTTLHMKLEVEWAKEHQHCSPDCPRGMGQGEWIPAKECLMYRGYVQYSWNVWSSVMETITKPSEYIYPNTVCNHG